MAYQDQKRNMNSSLHVLEKKLAVIKQIIGNIRMTENIMRAF